MNTTLLNPKTATLCGLLATFALTSLSPVLADPAGQQKNKNQWRNLGIAGAVIAGYGLLKHDKTATLLGAAGAAYSANRYETDRRHQSQDTGNRARYHRTYGNGRYYGWNPNSQNHGNQNYGNQNYDDQYYGSDSGNSDWNRTHDGDWNKNHKNRDKDRKEWKQNHKDWDKNHRDGDKDRDCD